MAPGGNACGAIFFGGFMIRVGSKPFLECSSKGDRRFSAFYARIRCEGNRSIEEIYQGAKVIHGISGHPWRYAKGRRAENDEEVRELYSLLWDVYFQENPDLLTYILQYNGFSDVFGQEGHVCQAIEIFRIHNESSTE